jgi:hypothetical protein
VLLPYWLNLRSVRELFRRDQAALPNQLKMRPLPRDHQSAFPSSIQARVYEAGSPGRFSLGLTEVSRNGRTYIARPPSELNASMEK